MRKLLNTLYITTPEAYLSRDGLNVVMLIDGKERFRIPIHNIEGIVTFGWSGASPSLLSLCAEHNVSVTFLTPTGYYCGRVVGPVHGNVLLRRQQYRFADQEGFSLNLAKYFIIGKIANSRNVIHRVLRDHGSDENQTELKTAMKLLENHIHKVKQVDHIEKLRGIEGSAANEYFSVFNHFIVANQNGFTFNGRSRRPPRDPVNALLSFCYSLLAHEVHSALESVGLDPYVGFFHTDRPGRPSLALDLMEELRPYFADRLTLTLINRKQVNIKGFIDQQGFGFIMSDETRKTVIAEWQKRKQEEIMHPFLAEKVQVGLIPYIQALLLARHIRGDLDMYPAFMMK